jgi:uncharacterized protein (DUF885 family)
MTNETLAAAAARLWDDLLEISPLNGTFVGDDRHDHELPRLGERGRDEERVVYDRAADAVAGVDPGSLDDEDRLTYDLVEAIVDRGRARLDSRFDRFEVASHLDGPATTLGVVASVQLTDTPERLDKYATRLDAFPRYMDDATALAREAVADRVLAPRVIVERSVALLDRVLAAGAEESPPMQSLADDAARARVLPIVRDRVLPAFDAFRTVLRDEVLPASSERIGLSSLPDGEALYAGEIMGWTSLPLEPGELHRLGRDRLDAIQEERTRLAAGLGYTSVEAAIADRTAKGENTAGSPAALLAIVEDQVARCWEAAPRYFGRLPRENCIVKLVEEFRQADQPFAFYNPPTEDGSRPGTYYVNPFELEDRALHHVAGVTFHESTPGHHFQIAIEQEIEGRDPLRRYGGWLVSSAFGEGWGLYAERLADEMGLYLDDWERLGMLENQGLRAARLVTDTGIHAFGWTRQAAIDLLMESGQTQADAVIEIDRYIGVPGQALCYMTGMVEIERARAAAEAAGRDLREFHDAVLANGSLPLPSFRRVFGLDGSGT